MHSISVVSHTYTMISGTPPPLYAPTGPSLYQPHVDSTNANRELTKDEVVGSNHAVYDLLAEIYLVIPTLEVVEKAFIKDFVTDKEKYTATCTRLIDQYLMLTKNIIDDHHDEVNTILGPDVTSDNITLKLCSKFRLQCPLAIKRLSLGYPATIQQMKHAGEIGSSQQPADGTATLNPGSQSLRLIAQVTGNFITVMDALRLGFSTKADLHPLISELVINLNDLVDFSKGPGDPKAVEFEGKSKLVTWLINLNKLGDDKLDDEARDQFLEDLDTAYKGFFTTLS